MNGLNQVITEQVSAAPKIALWGDLSVSSFIVTCWGITIFLTIVSLLLTRNLKVQNPNRVQICVELFVGFMNKFCKENLSHLGNRWRFYSPLLGSMALFLLCCNLSGLFGFTPPTKFLTVPMTLTLTSVFIIYTSQFVCLGFFKGLRRFAEPLPGLLPLNLMEVFIQPVSLCMRLFGNILAAHILMKMIEYLCPIVLPAIFSLYFDLFDGLLQMAVFTFLTLLYVGEQTHSIHDAQVQH